MIKEHSAIEYKKLLQSLLPVGKAWTRNDSSNLARLLYGLAEEFSRVEKRSYELFEETLIGKFNELLIEYEIEFDLYSESIKKNLSFDDRVNRVVSKIFESGSCHYTYFEKVFEAYGYEITIQEFKPALSGIVTCGESCGGLKNLFYWIIYIAIEYGVNYNLELVLNFLKKNNLCHTFVDIDFKGKSFNESFSSAFYSKPYFDNSWGGDGYGRIGNKGLDYSRDFSKAFSNAFDYDGRNYIGSFSQAFSKQFDRKSGGSFSQAFNLAYSLQH